MYIIIAAIIFAIVFYSWTTIKNVLSITIFSNTNITPQGFMWFGSILLINIIIFAFIIWFYYYIRDRPGPVGRQGFPGQSGDDANDCKTC
jgi:hypothetical protein